jgi:hypothetical protein
MSSITNYKFEEDAQAAFRSILQLSANYRALQEKYEQQEQTIIELTERLKLAERLNSPSIVPEKTRVINKPTTIGPLECKPFTKLANQSADLEISFDLKQK